MNLKNYLHILYFTVVLSSFNSCDKENNIITSPSIEILQVEGEGGIYPVAVKMTSSDWNIAKVINKNGDVRIAGEVYSTDGKLITKNYPVSMKGRGRIESIWRDKGFIITRTTTDSITIEVLENSTREPFSFGIVLQKGESTYEIIIEQKVSQGYQFHSIDYLIREGDRDSLFTRTTLNHTFNLPTPQTISFSPYGGVDIARHSLFVSDNPHAFLWISKDSVPVNVPESIIDGKVYLSNKKNVYGALTKTSYIQENPDMASLEIPGGKERKFQVELEYRKRIVSYVLTLINNRTKSEKKVEGKWIEVTPTGNYHIVKDW